MDKIIIQVDWTLDPLEQTRRRTGHATAKD